MRLGWVLLAGLQAMACATAAGPSASPALPAAAARFYPADPVRLRAAVDGFLRNAVTRGAERPIAIVAPHAGYLFSGQIAADAYAQAAGQPVDVVIILGPSHTGHSYQRISVFDRPEYRTPLGDAAVDRDLAAAIVATAAGAGFDSAAHDGEHSIDVQVPFVQRVFPEAAVVPIVVGVTGQEACERFGRALASALGGRRALIVASSDLSHYPAQRDAIATDARTLRAIAALDSNDLTAALEHAEAARLDGLATCACGEGPIRVAIAAARALGANRGTVVSYANSGDTVAGDPARVVGYGAVALGRGQRGADTAALARPVADAGGALDAADKSVLLRLARETIGWRLAADVTPLPRGGSGRLLRPAGAFVTLKRRGELRGCVGRLQAEGALLRLVSAVALEAAFNDPRFPPVRASELKDIDIEISVLTAVRPVAEAGAIRIGRDGVVLRAGRQSAVFLPQVAAEQGWTTTEQMLDQLARKAGLPERAWRDAGAQLFTFQAEVFSEAGTESDLPAETSWSPRRRIEPARPRSRATAAGR